MNRQYICISLALVLVLQDAWIGTVIPSMIKPESKCTKLAEDQYKLDLSGK
jgi:hypothetical protein